MWDIQIQQLVRVLAGSINNTHTCHTNHICHGLIVLDNDLYWGTSSFYDRVQDSSDGVHPLIPVLDFYLCRFLGKLFDIQCSSSYHLMF